MSEVTFYLWLQHYLKVHATRDHVCECGQAFSTTAHLAQHRRACGLDLLCTCGRSFHALETLQTHVRRFDHAIMNSTLQALRLFYHHLNVQIINIVCTYFPK